MVAFGQVLTMPPFFAGNAIYPIAIMPAWLQAIAHANPLTYEVDGLRALMLGSSMSISGLTLDFVVMLVVTAALVAIGGWLYPKVVV
jgi:ABC-2 type transport system permease protein